MGATYSIKFMNLNSEDKTKLKSAIDDILALSKLLNNSTNANVKDFLVDIGAPEESWLSIGDNGITVMAEKSVSIDKEDLNDSDIFYDFGKESPAPLSYILAVMAILHYYLPKAKMSSDAKHSQAEFDNGVALARLINAKIKNPFLNSEVISPSEYILGLCIQIQNENTEPQPTTTASLVFFHDEKSKKRKASSEEISPKNYKSGQDPYSTGTEKFFDEFFDPTNREASEKTLHKLPSEILDYIKTAFENNLSESEKNPEKFFYSKE